MGTRGLIHGYYPGGIRGLPGHRAHLRGFEVVITGVADKTQVTVEINGILVGESYNHDAIAAETLDTDFPTGGTNFNINAAGTEITVVGHDANPRFIISDRVREDATGVAMISHCHIDSGYLVVHATNTVTSADIDFTDLAAGVEIIFAICLLTEE